MTEGSGGGGGNDFYLREEILRLRGQNERLEARNRELEGERDELANGFDTIEKEFETYKGAHNESSLAKQNAELQKQVNVGKHRDAFRARAKGLKAEAFDDVFGMYKPDGDPSDAAIDAAIEKGRAKYGNWAFAEDVEQKQDPEPSRTGPGPGFTRGNADRTGSAGMPYTREQLQDPSFMSRNAAAIAKNVKEAVERRRGLVPGAK
jgi:hypothetical protein